MKVLALILVLCVFAVGQTTKSFIPVDGANLKAKIDAAVVAGKANATNGRFWVGYQFEARPGVAIDYEVVDSAGGVYITTDGTSIMFDPRHETRELGLFLLYDTQRETFIRAEVYNLRRDREYGGYPVYWAGHIGNEESLNYLKSIVDAPAEVNRLAERAMFAIALHDDVRVDAILTELIRRPVTEPMRSRAIYWLGNTPETAAKNTLFTEIVRNNQESTEARNAAMSALAMSRSAAVLPLLQNLFETMTTRDLKRRALTGIGRNDNDAAATYLVRVAESDADIELQKHAVVVLGRRPKDEAVPILIRMARNHPKMAVRKVAIQALGQTGDERAVAFFREILSKD